MRSQPTLLPGIVANGSMRARVLESSKPSRFVMQSHTLSRPIASPRALFIAAAIAVGLYLIGRRLSE